MYVLFASGVTGNRERERENQVERKISKTSRLRSQVVGGRCTSWQVSKSTSAERRAFGRKRKTTTTKILPGPTPVVAVVQVAGYRASDVPGRGVRRFYTTRPKVARPPFTGRPGGGDHGPLKYDTPRPCDRRTVFGVRWSPPMTRGDRVMVQRSFPTTSANVPVSLWKTTRFSVVTQCHLCARAVSEQ